MKRIVSQLLVTSLILTSSLSHAWFKETAITAFNTIKKHPVVLSAVGFATAAACWYKASQYQKKSNDDVIFITGLIQREKDLINQSIEIPLNNNQEINVGLKFYDKINSKNMSRLGKATLAVMVEAYNKALKEQRHLEQHEPGQIHPELRRAEQKLREYIFFLDHPEAAITYVQKLEQRSDMYYIFATVCGIASCIPLAIAYNR